jgi:hypothetical protein
MSSSQFYPDAVTRAHIPPAFLRLYRAFVQPAADSRGPELAVFVEAAGHQSAIRKIANAIAAVEGCLPDTVAERTYNVYSARELIEDGLGDDIEGRVFECGWSGGKPTCFVDEPLFLMAAPAALIRKWAQIAEVAHG